MLTQLELLPQQNSFVNHNGLNNIHWEKEGGGITQEKKKKKWILGPSLEKKYSHLKTQKENCEINKNYEK